jgi:hypothetical protein
MLDYSLRGSPLVLRTGITSPRKYFHPPEPSFQLFNAVVKPISHLTQLRTLQLPLPSRYDSFVLRKRARHGLPNLKHVDVGKRKSIRDVEDIFTPRELQAELDFYAPEVEPTVSSSAPTPAPAPVPDIANATRFDPARYITPRSTACLSIRLVPDVSPSPPRDDLPNLLWGIMPTHTAYSVLSRKQVMPLMYKIESLGLDRGALAMAADFDRRTNVLHLSFPSRSAEDMQHILGETLDDPLFVVSEWADAGTRADRGSLRGLGLPSRAQQGYRESRTRQAEPAAPSRLVSSPISSSVSNRRARRVREWNEGVSRSVSAGRKSEEKTWSARSAISSAITSATRSSSGSSSNPSSEAGEEEWETASEWSEGDSFSILDQ